ncbi:hypothetical protein PV325_007513 [Microctonus aethiopoides]|nr:hypothetical protein PV325_007513 [Microctonus aethiopoides]
MFTSIKYKSNTNRSLTKASTKRDLDWAIGWIRVALQILGLWTYPKQSKFTAVLSHIHTAVLALVIFFLQILPQTIALIKVWGMTGLIIDNITMNLPSMVAEFKFIVLWYKKHDLAGIFAMITQDWLGKKSNRERDVMIKCAKISKIFTIGGSIGSIACANLIFTPVIFNTVIRTVNNITDIPDRLFALQTVYFHDVTQLGIYRLTVLSQCICSTIVIFLYSGVDVLFGMIVMHLCGQLKILSYKFETMANHRQSFQKHLKINVKRHCTLIRFRNETENIFSDMVLALIVLFSIFSNQDKTSVAQISCYIVMIIYFLFLMFVYSWVGQNLVTQSESLFTAVYNCNWVTLTPSEFRQIILILIRTRQPLYITAGKFSPIIKTSCGWVSVLLAAKNKF